MHAAYIFLQSMLSGDDNMIQNKSMVDSIATCLDCYKTCAETKAHCIEMGGTHVSAKHLMIMEDCIRICQISADFIIRNSPHHHHIAKECAEICRECATACDAFPEEFMKECARHCNNCADSCEKMAGAHTTAASKSKH